MPDIGAKITLEGERAYREALKEITNGQKVMRAELELVTAKFDGQGDAIDALAEKKDVLERTLNGERDRIDVLSDALERAATQFGEADQRTMKYQEQLYAAQTAAAKLEGQIQTLNGQMADREKADRFSDAIRQQADAIDGATQRQEMLESEMKKLDAQYDATGNKSEILREKQRNLTEQITNQQTKIDALREVLEKASETYGENSDEVRRWQKEMDSAEGELAEMQGALDDTTDKAGDGQGGLGHAIVQLADKFGITLPEGMKATLESFGQFDAGTALVIGGAGAIASARRSQHAFGENRHLNGGASGIRVYGGKDRHLRRHDRQSQRAARDEHEHGAQRDKRHERRDGVPRARNRVRRRRGRTAGQP